MIKKNKPCNYWTKDKCQEESLKYKTRTEFSKKSNGCYNASLRKGWLDEICKHMSIKGNRYHKCIYSYEFSNNSVYIGLTYDLDVRQKNRNNDKKDTVTKYINETKLQPIRKQLTDYIDVNEAIKLEGYYVEKYKNDGWNVLNKAKTGSIGGTVVKWTFEKCKEEALKYKTRTEFSIKSNGCYDSCKRNKWLNKVCSHMTSRQKPKNYWTYEKCKKESLKYNSKNEFKKLSNGAYLVSTRNGWLNDFIFIITERPNKIWTYEKCKEESLKYKTKIDFHKNSRGSYNTSYKNGWLNEFFK